MPENSLHTIRTGYLFPWTFNFLGILVTLAGFFLFLDGNFGGIFLVPAACITLLSFNGVEVNPVKKIFRNYVWIMGFKFGKSESYNDIEKLFIVSQIFQSVYYSRVSTSSTIRVREFTGYIEFSNGEKLKLTSGKSHNKTLSKMKKYAEILNSPLDDISGYES
jgi:hypothetical protein